jgi:hypothetical protein
MRCHRQGIALTAAAAIGMLAAACSTATTASPASSPSAANPGTTQPAVSQPVTSAAAASTTPAASPRVAAKATSSCDVITQAEAATALGQPVQPPVTGHTVVEGGVACVFNGPNEIGADPDVLHTGTVRVALVIGPEAKVYFDDYESKVNAQSLSGLGDKAYYDGFASVSVLKGDEYVRIYVGTPSNLDVEKTLAAAALTRM